MNSIPFLLAATMLLPITPLQAEETIEKHPTRSDVDGVANEDQEMLQAQKKARDSLRQFVAAVQKRDEAKRYLLKVKLSEGKQVEHVWLEPVKWHDPGLVGILAVDPVGLKEKKKGDVIAPLPSDVTDWLILSPDGSKEGGFTVDVIAKRESKSK